MKKLIIAIIITVLTFTFAACGNTEEALSEQIIALKTEISELEETKASLKQEIVDTSIQNGTAKYVITLNIKQTHFSLDITQHLKDAMNDISLELPVDKEFYDSVEIGDVLDDSFRMGSFIFKGSFGSWKVTIEDKEIKY